MFTAVNYTIEAQSHSYYTQYLAVSGNLGNLHLPDATEDMSTPRPAMAMARELNSSGAHGAKS